MYYRPPKYTDEAPINGDESSVTPYTVRFYYGYSYDYYLERCPCCGEPVISGWNYCPFCGCDLRKGKRQK